MGDDLDSAAGDTENDGTGGAARPNGAQPTMTREAKERADKDAFLSMWNDEEKSGALNDRAEAAAPAPKKPATKPPAKPVEEVEDDDELDVAGASADADDDVDLDDDDDELEPGHDDDEEAATTAAAGAKDPDLAKRLDQVRKNEKRGRDQLARDRQAFEKERDGTIAEWKPRIQAAQEFERLKASAKADPVALLLHAGVGEDDFEDISKMIYAMSPAAKSDPKNRAAAAALKRERDLRTRVEASEARQKALEEKLTKQENDAVHAKRVEAYVNKVASAIGEATPLLKKSMEIAPKATRAKLERLAYKMAMEANSLDVDPKTVVKRFEKIRRAAIERDRPLGELLAGASSGAAKPAAAAGGAKKPAIAVEDRTAISPAKPAAPTNGAAISFPSRADIIAKLREGNLDD